MSSSSSGPAWTRERKRGVDKPNQIQSNTPSTSASSLQLPFYSNGATSSSSLIESSSQDAPFLAHAVRHHGQYTLVPPDNNGRRRHAGEVASTSSTAIPGSSTASPQPNELNGTSTGDPAATVKVKKKKKKSKKPAAPDGPPDPAILQAVQNAGRNTSVDGGVLQLNRPDSTHSGGNRSSSLQSQGMTRSTSSHSFESSSWSALRGPRALPPPSTESANRPTPSPSPNPPARGTGDYPFPRGIASHTNSSSSLLSRPARPPPQAPNQTQSAPVRSSPASIASMQQSQPSQSSTLFDTPIHDSSSVIPPAFESPPPPYIAPPSRLPSPLALPTQATESIQTPTSPIELMAELPSPASLDLPEIESPETIDIDPLSRDPLHLAWEADRAAGIELNERIQRDCQRRQDHTTTTVITGVEPILFGFAGVSNRSARPCADVHGDREGDTIRPDSRTPGTSPSTPPVATSSMPPALTSVTVASSSAAQHRAPSSSVATSEQPIRCNEDEEDMPRLARALSISANQRFADAAERRLAQARDVEAAAQPTLNEILEEVEPQDVALGPVTYSFATARPWRPGQSRKPSPGSQLNDEMSAGVASTSRAMETAPPIPSVHHDESSESEEEQEEGDEQATARLARAVTLNARRRFAEVAERRAAMERAFKQRQEQSRSIPSLAEDQVATQEPLLSCRDASAVRQPRNSSVFHQLFPPRPRFGEPVLAPAVQPDQSCSSAARYSANTVAETTVVARSIDLFSHSPNDKSNAESPGPPLPPRPSSSTPGSRLATLDELLDTPLSHLINPVGDVNQRASLRRAPPIPRSRPSSVGRVLPPTPTAQSLTSHESVSRKTPPPSSEISPSFMSAIPTAERGTLPAPIEPAAFSPSPPRPRRPAPLPPPPRGASTSIAPAGALPDHVRRPLPVPPRPSERLDAFTVMRMRENALANLENRQPRTSAELRESDRSYNDAMREAATADTSLSPVAQPSTTSQAPLEMARQTGVMRGALAGTHDLTAYTELDLLLARLDNEANTNAYEDLTTLGEVLGPATEIGASQAELETLDVARVELERRRIDKHGKVKQKLSIVGVRCIDCTICLARFKVGEMAVVLPECLHVFHEGCIVRWLARSRTCALCRANIFPPRPVIDI